MMILLRLCFRIAVVFVVAVSCLLWFAAIGAAQNTDRPRPTYADVAYGPHERNVVDFYKVDSDKPTPLVVYFHGGGWRNGSKKDLKHKFCGTVMESGFAFAVANYRLTGHAPHPAQLHDAARAIQFLRSKAAEWNIDPKRIAAYGASAKGSTLLNYFGIGPDEIEFVADRSTVKQGHCTPGTHIPIVAPDWLVQKMPDYVLLLTWNFRDEILKQQTGYREAGGKFIIPVPQVEVV